MGSGGVAKHQRQILLTASSAARLSSHRKPRTVSREPGQECAGCDDEERDHRGRRGTLIVARSKITFDVILDAVARCIQEGAMRGRVVRTKAKFDLALDALARASWWVTALVVRSRILCHRILGAVARGFWNCRESCVFPVWGPPMIARVVLSPTHEVTSIVQDPADCRCVPPLAACLESSAVQLLHDRSHR